MAVPGIGRSLASAVVSTWPEGAPQEPAVNLTTEKCSNDRRQQPASPETPGRRPDRHRHRHERRRPQHDGQRPRGPRLARRRQPAARSCSRTSPSCATRPGRAPRAHLPAGRRRRRRAAGGWFAQLEDAIRAARAGGSDPASCSSTRPTRPSCGVSRACAARTRCRATAGSSTASARARAAPRPAFVRRRRHRHAPASTSTS